MIHIIKYLEVTISSPLDLAMPCVNAKKRMRTCRLCSRRLTFLTIPEEATVPHYASHLKGSYPVSPNKSEPSGGWDSQQHLGKRVGHCVPQSQLLTVD